MAVVGGTEFAYVLLGNPDGTLQPAQVIPLPSKAYMLVAGDFINDGKTDLAIAAKAVLLLPGNGDGTFGSPTLKFVGYDAFKLSAADLDGDGNLDLVVTCSLFGVYADPSDVVLLLGKGDGTFQPQVLSSGSYDAPSTFLYDLNGDGVPDLVQVGVVVNAPGDLTVALGKGDGTFQQSYSYNTQSFPVWIGAADFLAHGRPDVVTLSGDSSLTEQFLSSLPDLGGDKLSAPQNVDFGQQLHAEVLADSTATGISTLRFLNQL